MLKKAGILVATAAAGLLAVSPLAVAGEGHHGHHDGDTGTQINSVEQDRSQHGLLDTGTGSNTGDTNTNLATQNCGNDGTNIPTVALPAPPAPIAPADAPADAPLGVLAPAPTSGHAAATSQVACDQTSSAGNSTSQTNNND